MASRIKRTAKLAWCNPWVRLFLTVVAMVLFPVLASIRAPDPDGVDATVKSIVDVTERPSICPGSPGSFAFELHRDSVEVPRRDVRGVLQETLYTFQVRKADLRVSKDDVGEYKEVEIPSGIAMPGHFRRQQYFNEQRTTTGWVTWQPFHLNEGDKAIFGGPDDRVKWGVAEKWHALRSGERRANSQKRSTPKQMQRGERWLWKKKEKKQQGPSLMARIWETVLRLAGYGEMMTWWAEIRRDPQQSWLGGLLLYTLLADIGQQLVHVGFDEELVREGRNFCEDNDGKPDVRLEDRLKSMAGNLEASRSQMKDVPSDMDIGSSGVTCLHFEPPRESQSFNISKQLFTEQVPPSDNKTISWVSLPLRKKLFLYSGQSTLWPEPRVGTLSGVAFLDVPQERGDVWELSMFVSIGTYAEMPGSMFAKTQEKFVQPQPPPVFYVGTLDHTEPSQRRTGNRDCRTNPADGDSLFDGMKKKLMRAAARMPVEFIGAPPTRPVISRTRKDNPCFNEGAVSKKDKTAFMKNASRAHDFSNIRARGINPLTEGNMTTDDLGAIASHLERTFRCSGNYLWVPADDHVVYFGEVLAWVHFMMEAPITNGTERDVFSAMEHNAWNF
eukprot:TRINITY_DN115025_c0_g1_i1.p1 TRINITY_DN115025_c0_g1~~TRINITY_DN115025_c0_g1_i1.p1  ORF type:complete len:677 (-),score=41.17 TRINITY_DN115025_c0_g1_i1:101-1939(-)